MNGHAGTDHSVRAHGTFAQADLNPRAIILTPTTVTIATGVITVLGSAHRVETESAAASDDVDTIQPKTLSDGFRLWLAPIADARSVVIKHETGNISCIGGSDITLDDIEDWAELWYDAPNDQWYASFGNQDTAPTRSVNTTAVGNVGVGEDDLITYSLLANTLNANGKGVRITAWGTLANNANAKTLKLYFGSATILTQALTINSLYIWRITALVFRTAADTQVYHSEYDSEITSTPDWESGTPAEDDGAAITIKCTGEATANNDIVQSGLLVEVL